MRIPEVFDLGYVLVKVRDGWTISVSNFEEDSVARLSLPPAYAELRLFSGRFEIPEESLNLYFDNFQRQWQSSGLHVDDLADDQEFELLCEIPLGKDNESQFMHVFMTEINQVIVEIRLFKYLEEDEEAMRELISNVVPGSIQNENDFGLQIPISIRGENWNQIGNLAVASNESWK